MDEARQQKTIDSLRDWSKWLIGLDFGAATGCTVILQGDFAGPTTFLVLAVSAFALSVASSVVAVRSLASLAEVLPLQNEGGQTVSVYSYRVWGSLTVGTVTLLQLVLFFLGVLFFLAWVI